MADGTAKRMMHRDSQTNCVRTAFDEDARIEVSVRPNGLDEYIGKRVKENIRLHRCGADRGEALDHVLLYGPPGLGKPPWRRSSPRIERAIKTSAGPLLERKGDLTAY